MQKLNDDVAKLALQANLSQSHQNDNTTNAGNSQRQSSRSRSSIVVKARQALLWLLFVWSIVPFFMYGDRHTMRSIFSVSAWLPSSQTAHIKSSLRFLSYPHNVSGDEITAPVILSPFFRLMLVVGCLFGTIAFPLFFDALLRNTSGNRPLFSASQLQSRNVHSQPMTLTCLAASVATALQGVVWIIWGMQVGQISMTMIEVQPIDITVADTLTRYLLSSLSLSSSSSSSSSLSSSVLVGVVWLCRSVGSAWLMLLIADLSSYGYHRLGHEVRWCWKYIHYLHHENHYPNHGFFSLQYGAVLDMVLSNSCFFLGFIILHCDLFTLTLFSVASTSMVTAGHSGLDLSHLPFLHSLFHPEYHATHHWKFSVNYSEHFTIVDRLFGTLMVVSPPSATTKTSATNRDENHDYDARSPNSSTSASLMKDASGA